MDFGKLFNVDRVRMDLPPEDPRSVLPGTRSSAVNVYVGGPVWSCPKWLGKVYPKGTAAKDYLREYAAQLNSIELNSSFYRIPDPETVAKWREVVPPDFRFAPKLFQGISHVDDFAAARASLDVFWKSVPAYGENLGICFLQLPPHVTARSIGSLRRLLDLVPTPRDLAVEFRHPSWFSGGRLVPQALELLRERGISPVITDTAGRRDVVHSTLTSRRAMIRFVGNELHPSDFLRLDAWVDRLHGWIERGLEEVYFFVHQPTEAEVPELIEYFVKALGARSGLAIRSWVPVKDEGARPQAQMSLF